MKVTTAAELIVAEYESAENRYPPFSSLHEGYAIILEELDELWDEIKKKPLLRNNRYLRAEAKQIAAMALRFMVDLCEEDTEDKHQMTLACVGPPS